MSEESARFLRFGPFALDVRAREIRKHGSKIRLQEQSYQILLMLLEHPGEVVLREEIRLRLWPNNTIVEFDHSINAAIKRLRNALGESAGDPRYIETLAKRGYRCVCEVERVGPPGPERAQTPQTAVALSNTNAGAAGGVVSRYRILGKLGEGGMGVVYRAEDTKLGRQVALKFLPSATDDLPATLLQRFEREARAASALNHPNICTIYGLEDCGGQPAIAMELVEGETLAARLVKGRLPREEALRVAIQIASAMAEAHRKGVVHRDLKPRNIMLTKAGVKVLDFGLAKMERAAAAGNETITVTGAVLGTPLYMSPELAQGREADSRTDLFSFGVVLYEMLAGKPPFEGQSTPGILAAILEREPPPLGEDVSAPLDRVVRRCLAKDREERWQSALDLQAELEWIAGTLSAEPPASATLPARAIDWRWIAGGILAVAVLALAVLFLSRKPAPAPVVAFHVYPPENNVFGGNPGPNVSPDGRRFVLATIVKGGGYKYWIRSLDSPEPTPIPGTEQATFPPFWSPDGRSIAFFTADKLKKIDLGGLSTAAEPVTLCTVTASNGNWGRSGVILFSTAAGPIYRVPDSGGSPAPATRLDETKQEGGHFDPWFLPDGRHFLFEAAGPSNSLTIRVGSLDTQQSKVLFTADSNAIYSQGFLLFLRDDNLMAEPFDPRKLVTTGDAVTIAEHVLPFAEKGPFSASENGTLVYQSIGDAPPFELVWFDRNGNRLSTLAGGYPETFPVYPPHFSPDRRSIALASREQHNADIWLYDAVRGNRSRFTFDPAVENAPVWSPDGRTIAFASNRNGHSDIYKKATDQSGAEELLYADSDQKYPTSWSPDGRFLAFDRYSTKEPSSSIWILPMQRGHSGSPSKPFPLSQTAATGQDGQFSPDGRWIAYHSRESRRYETYVEPFPPGTGSPGGRRLISTNGGMHPRWRADGKEIFYLQFRNLLAVSMEVSDRTLKVGEPQPIIGPLSILGYDVAPDGQRFLLRLRNPAVASQPMTVVQNWTAALK